MRNLHIPAHADRRANQLVIMLPGALQQPEEFVQAGFIDAVRERGLPIDLTLVDLGIEYIGDSTNGTVLQQIETTLIQAAIARQYEHIWLGGISIGGMIAIAYANRYPGHIDGLCLLSPYPGNRILLREIRDAGGLDEWKPGTDQGDDAERSMWQWLQNRGAQPRIHMGYGTQDRFAAGLQQIAATLPPQEVDAIPGEHDWPTWRKLWENFLDRSSLNSIIPTTDTAE